MAEISSEDRLKQLFQESNSPAAIGGADYDDTDLGGVDGTGIDLEKFGGELIPDNTWVPVVIAKSKSGKTATGKLKMDLDVQVTDGPYKGRHLWPLIMLEGEGRTQLFALADVFGQYDKVAGRVTCKVGDFLSKKMWVKVVVEPAQDYPDTNNPGKMKKGQDRNKVGYCQFAKWESRALESVGVATVGVPPPPPSAPIPALPPKPVAAAPLAPAPQPQPIAVAAPVLQPTPVAVVAAPVPQPVAPVPAPVAVPVAAPAPAPPVAVTPVVPPTPIAAAPIAASWNEVPIEE